MDDGTLLAPEKGVHLVRGKGSAEQGIHRVGRIEEARAFRELVEFGDDLLQLALRDGLEPARALDERLEFVLLEEFEKAAGGGLADGDQDRRRLLRAGQFHAVDHSYPAFRPDGDVTPTGR